MAYSEIIKIVLLELCRQHGAAEKVQELFSHLPARTGDPIPAALIKAARSSGVSFGELDWIELKASFPTAKTMRRWASEERLRAKQLPGRVAVSIEPVAPAKTIGQPHAGDIRVLESPPHGHQSLLLPSGREEHDVEQRTQRNAEIPESTDDDVSQLIHSYRQQGRAGTKPPPDGEDARIGDIIETLRRPWHIGLMNEYRDLILPEAIPYISAVQTIIEKGNKTLASIYAAMEKARTGELPEIAAAEKTASEKHGDSYLPFARFVSIRQAIAIGRLCRLVEGTAELERASWWYAKFEEQHILSAEGEFDTVHFDKALREGRLMEEVQAVFSSAIEKSLQEDEPPSDFWEDESAYGAYLQT